jgi:hypothetical protein
MKRKHGLLFVLILIVAGAGLAVAQESLRRTAFQVETQIGFPLPSRLIYDPVFDRYSEIDAYGALHLVDGKTFARQHTLYTEGGYNDFAFSNDGRWLALAIEQRIELWDAQTGELAASLTDPSEARRIYGPLQFSDDDQLLLFYGTYPAPQELRRFENDTTEVPWLWHLPSAREEGDSPFPRQVEALPFFDYRNGFVMGPNARIVAALPGWLHVLDALTTEVLYEIDTARFEQDPLTVLRSARDQRIYVRPVQVNTLIQVDADRGVLVEFPLFAGLTLDDLNALGNFKIGRERLFDLHMFACGKGGERNRPVRLHRGVDQYEIDIAAREYILVIRREVGEAISVERIVAVFFQQIAGDDMLYDALPA